MQKYFIDKHKIKEITMAGFVIVTLATTIEYF